MPPKKKRRTTGEQKFIDDFKEAIRAAELIAGRPLGEFLSEQGAILAGIAARDAPTGGSLGRLAGEAAALGTNIALLRAENPEVRALFKAASSGAASSGAASSGAGPGPPGVYASTSLPAGPMVAAATPMVATDNFNSSSGFPGISQNVFASLNGRAQDQAMHSAFSGEAPLQEPELTDAEMAEDMDLQATLMDDEDFVGPGTDIFEGLPDEASEEEEAGSEFTDSFFK